MTPTARAALETVARELCERIDGSEAAFQHKVYPEYPCPTCKLLRAALLAQAAETRAEDLAVCNAKWNEYGSDPKWGAAQQAAVAEVESAIRAIAPAAPEAGKE